MPHKWYAPCSIPLAKPVTILSTRSPALILFQQMTHPKELLWVPHIPLSVGTNKYTSVSMTKTKKPATGSHPRCQITSARDTRCQKPFATKKHHCRCRITE